MRNVVDVLLALDIAALCKAHNVNPYDFNVEFGAPDSNLDTDSPVPEKGAYEMILPVEDGECPQTLLNAIKDGILEHYKNQPELAESFVVSIEEQGLAYFTSPDAMHEILQSAIKKAPHRFTSKFV